MSKVNLYRAKEWVKFSENIKKRDGGKCLKCHRGSSDVVLQVHHEIYKEGRKPWDYDSSACITLCSGCHAREHDLIEPTNGWALLSINDLGGLDGHCERRGCGNAIRYEYYTYHPKWGYQTVGSTCVEHLTKEDIELGKDTLSAYKKVRSFLAKTTWSDGIDIECVRCLKTSHMMKHIFIYQTNEGYSFSVRSNYGARLHDPVEKSGVSLDKVKELSSITLFGLNANMKKDKETFRRLYKSASTV